MRNDTAPHRTAALPERPAIALVGAGPRGASLLERIGASLGELAPEAEIDIHVIDPEQSGAGRIWRTDQDRELCMNTLAHAVTLFTEPGAAIDGPVIEGPTLYEWCLLAREGAGSRIGTAAGIPASHRAAYRAHPARAGFAADYRSELAGIRPESHPSRALYGEYLAWAYARAVALLPAGVRVIRHRARAVGLQARRTGPGGPARDALRLAAGRAGGGTAGDETGQADAYAVEADATILATGWMPHAETAEERRILAAQRADPGLVWVRPESPAEQDFSAVPDGARAIVRGLGMGFFDAAALLTIGRGGRFVDDDAAPGGLRYEASGREPILHVASRRGVPFRAKSRYGSLPPRPRQRTLLGVDWSRVPRPIDFDAELWPRIVTDAYLDYYETLHRVRPGAFAAPLAEVVRAIEATAGSLDALDAALAPLVPRAEDRFDLRDELEPVREDFADPAAFDAWVRRRVEHDLAEAALGRDSALKAGLWSISSARAVANRLGSLGGFDAESRAGGFATLVSVGGMVGSGPPAFRSAQLLALAEAGIVRFVGPEARLEIGADGFTASSPRVAGSAVTAPVLIDAWMHLHRVSETADPLARELLSAGRARPFSVRSRDGSLVATGGFDVDPATGRLVGEGGAVDPRVHMVGIPLDDTLHETIISPMPGTDPPMLRETDRVARSALRVVSAAAAAAAEAAASTTVGAGSDADAELATTGAAR